MKKIIILVFLILISCGVNESSNIDSDSTTKTTIDISNNETSEEIEYFLNEKNIPIKRFIPCVARKLY